MHELAVATGIVEIAEATLHENGLKKIYAVQVVIGELTCVDESALRFAFEPASKGTVVENAELHIIVQKALAKCEPCDLLFAPCGFVAQCPICSGFITSIVNGRELYVKSIEAE